jgi:phosphoglycolate phosphatase
MEAIDFDVVAFDLDGTLADTAPDLAAALNHTLEQLARPALPAEAVRNMVGHGARELLRKGLQATGVVSEELVGRALPIFLDYYGAHICENTRVYSGFEAALDMLAERQIATAICTNKPERLTRKLVAALGWEGRFASIVGGVAGAQARPGDTAGGDRAGGWRPCRLCRRFDHRRGHRTGGRPAAGRSQLRLLRLSGRGARRSGHYRPL